jgi:hypothetical protein
LAGRPWPCSRKRAATSTTFFPSETLAEAGRASGFIERQRKLTAENLTTTLAFWKGDTLGYSDLTADIALKYGEDVTKQALQEKLDGPAAEAFFQALVAKALSAAQAHLPRPVIRLPGVGRILIADASSLALRRALSEHLPGTGGSGPEASLKIHGLVDLTSQQFCRIALSTGKTSDHSEKEAHALILKESDLIIRDMGYFDISDLDALRQAGRFYLTRIPLSTKTFKDLADNKRDVWSEMASSTRFSFDTQLKVGDEGFVTRLVALRLPRQKAKERLAAMAKEKGRALTTVEKAQAKWNLFMTNLSVEQASVETLQRLYSWRWQIELIWKAWKSVLDIDSVKTATCAAVVKVYVWARLLFAVVMMTVRGVIQSESRQEIGVICWYRRLSPQLATMRELLRRERWCALARLLIELGTKHCRREKRHRNTTLEEIRQSAGLGRFSTGRSNP